MMLNTDPCGVFLECVVAKYWIQESKPIKSKWHLVKRTRIYARASNAAV